MPQAAPYPSHADATERDAPVVPHPILGRPDFARLQRMRRRFAWTLTAAMLMAYFGFILTLAFRPALLAVPLVAGRPMTVGIPIGFGMFAFTFALVALYVHRSNTVYDRLIAGIRQGELQ
ncbi:hypothetical protein BKK79_22495 [Cupriavidus sp. USMAA2-4]|uniref:DUF485 domain-containing protein n=1 Tax=Cupriavidus malaysiensis TaxID=367825 RepID=A0ABN4TZH3_9BURK|nr:MULTISPECIES: DUF485 domain-containing protein [Cupriavidus]AOY94677.1 hypothetical protein BKK79_22495 [Cupriavidus sp. USMAA2-4]AOZ02463.1 hypothetical protein BKK81_24755 [Cupriavidus sp. USMAHM13]AOZ10174.1 hypothetical protein BKK80_31610 [Cupriavidus malaysiensis]